MSRVLNAEGADNGLDVGVSLLTFGLLPQRVRLHGEVGDPDPGMRPRPHPQDLRRLSFSSQDMTFPSPCFDFGEKVSRYLRSQNDNNFLIIWETTKITAPYRSQNVSRKIWKWFDFDWQGVRVWYYLEECIQLGWGWRWGRKETFAPCNVNYHLRAWCITTGLLSLNQSESRVRQIG